MKKLAISLALILGLGFSQVNAQTVSGGMKVEGNMSNFILTDMDGMKSNLGFGATIGGFGIIEFNQHFSFRPEMQLHFKTSQMEAEANGAKTDYQYFGVEIPLYAVGQMQLWNGKGYVGIGPYVGFGIDARNKADGADDIDLYKEYNDAKSAMQRWDVGAGIILGYEFSNRISINASYKMGFLDALNANKDNATMLPQTISLGMGYRF